MKILELRFKNINSLYGEWCIDFTDPEYTVNGIFALTGPTGAGKSTILDAMCLALYGATPRLGKITKGANEIMSRQTGECYAEVLFASQAGRFRCHWEQHRGRKRPDASLQEPLHQIADATTGKLLESKKSLVPGIVEEKTGMDFDRFTRSILLAQGGFDTFLKADIEQKSKILEQITGTEIYSEISRSVHERQRLEREKLTMLIAEVSGITLLDTDQEAALQNEIAAQQAQEITLNAAFDTAQKAILWLTGIQKLQEELAALDKKADTLNARTEAFAPSRERLAQANAAATLDGPHATLMALRKQQEVEQAALHREKASLPACEDAVRKQAQVCETAEQAVQKAKNMLRETSPLLRQVRLLDQSIATQASTVEKEHAACRNDAARIASQTQAKCDKEKEQELATHDLQSANSYLTDHAQDAWLVGGLAGVAEQLTHLQGKLDACVQQEAACTRADGEVTTATACVSSATEQCVCSQKAWQVAQDNLEQARRDLRAILQGKLLREYRTEKETLLREQAYLQRIRELEDYREKLEDGTPCPLCGATEHPFARGNVPAPDANEQKIAALTELIHKAETQESVQKKLEEAETAAKDALHAHEAAKALALNNEANARKTRDTVQEVLKTLRTACMALTQDIYAKLQPLGIKDVSDVQRSTLLAELTARLRMWQEQERRKADIERQCAAIRSDITRLEGVITTEIAALTEKQNALAQKKDALEEVKAERARIYDDKKPDAEENRLNAAINSAEEQEKISRENYATLHQQLMTTNDHINTYTINIATRTEELQDKEAAFLCGIRTAGFADEASFCRARLSLEERQRLDNEATLLASAWTELKTTQQDRQQCLAAEIDKKLTDQPLAAVEIQRKNHEAALQDVRAALVASNHMLRENALAKERIKEKQSNIMAQKTECQRWDKLHSLIGSADGKKYRSFAQGLTFEVMIAHANRQLVKMSDRYLLLRDKVQPLELYVIDNYQAGEVRSTKNLSGGESFIISLTLALGLSKMASQKVRVDSLFLDEGFGSLDEETLETALETLANLQQDNKLIGVISHVSALKERISTQIVVRPVSGGRSVLSGPGCTTGHKGG